MLLNLGCGGNRPPEAYWINIDNLHAIFPDPSVPERINMDAESNYKNADLSKGIPFPDSTVDGILCSHLLEHLNCQESVSLLRECRRVLKPNGVLRISLPDPNKFYTLTCKGLTDWGEPNPSKMSFMEYALFFAEHKQLISKESLYCMLLVSGFSPENITESTYKNSLLDNLASLDNRPVFSAFYEIVKVT